jgi:hypothetical protein
VPGFLGRFYSMQLTDPFDVGFAYAGTRTTGTKAGDYLVTKPGQKGAVSQEMKQLSSSTISALVLGRILVIVTGISDCLQPRKGRNNSR